MNREDDNDQEHVPVSEQAAYWWEVMHGDQVTAADRRDFGEWVARSPERVGAYLRVEHLMQALKSSKVRWPETPAEVLVREAKTAHTDVVPLFQPDFARPRPMFAKRAERTRGGTGFWISSMGIVAVVAVVTVAGWLFMNKPERYLTVLGEQHSVVLNDGSLVTLNTASSIEVEMQRERRQIRLLEGEALFQVAEDRDRPFEVSIDGTTVRAVGTQFNIDRRPNRITVTVIDGKVTVDDVPVAVAERVVITDAKLGPVESVENLSLVTAWTQRRLVFENSPLGDVAAEFNRYNRRHIEIGSVALRQREVTGTFQANDPESFVAFLSHIPGVAVSRTKEGFHVVMVGEGSVQ